ncbi:MAG: hypothetical protein PW791_15295 [Neorhizobium sp.]|nr:hypothetical protein [Neorhizobium sp.]
MKTTNVLRVGMGAAGLLAATLTLSGCMGPTYGTDKPAMAQLGDDLGASVAIGASEDQKAKSKIRYNPRPSLVVANPNNDNLPQPQASLTDRANNPNWVESPEETRQRLRAEADRNVNNPNYRSPLIAGKGQAGQMTETEKWQAFRDAKKKAETADMSATRTSLTEPPTAYRSADEAALSDLGQPELQKEKERKKKAEETSNSSSWWKPFQ